MTTTPLATERDSVLELYRTRRRVRDLSPRWPTFGQPFRHRHLRTKAGVLQGFSQYRHGDSKQRRQRVLERFPRVHAASATLQPAPDRSSPPLDFTQASLTQAGCRTMNSADAWDHAPDLLGITCSGRPCALSVRSAVPALHDLPLRLGQRAVLAELCAEILDRVRDRVDFRLGGELPEVLLQDASGDDRRGGVIALAVRFTRQSRKSSNTSAWTSSSMRRVYPASRSSRSAHGGCPRTARGGYIIVRRHVPVDCRWN